MDIRYLDPHFVAVHKPPGMLVHRTAISDGDQFVVQELRNQLGEWVFPIHRLDRAACGLLILGRNAEAASEMGKIWQEKAVRKTYQLVVRGWINEPMRIDRPLPREKDGQFQDAISEITPLANTEIPLAIGKYATARYTWVEARPETGRFHQLRRHLAGEGHPVLGDYRHGDYRHNNAIEAHFGTHRLMLCCTQLDFIHPFTQAPIILTTEWDAEGMGLIQQLGLSP